MLNCPKCKKGTILKGSTAFGCSNYKNGCDFKIMFEQYGKKLTDNQIQTLMEKGKTRKIKNLKVNGESIEGALRLGEGFEVVVG
ncbi:MAG: hypothetical protein K9G70_13510 [Prolixibacteraceae bacterium]|nr:hypothetical protein [Prolixibacteraceae bacterium]